jgi:hypothetical protein
VNDFFADFWASMWTSDALLGDRIKGVIFILLVVSVLAMLGGLIADAFVRRARQEAARERKANAGSKAGQPPAPPSHGAPASTDVDLGRALTFFSPLCANLPVSTGASIIFFLLLGLLALDHRMRWAGAAAAIPALLVLLQYVYLWAHKPAATDGQDDNAELESQAERAVKAVESSYGARTLFIRYGFPAVVLLVECLVLAFVLVNHETFLGLRWEPTYGAQFGAVGAYAWVVLELGRRSFRRDVTSGIALWCVVTLAIGPLLAATLALIWKPTPKAGDAWQHAVVLFYAGYAPRKVLAAITSAANQLLSGGPAPHVETRNTPLTKIRGISPQIEERLAEEGVENVENLATVEPIRLLRDTPYDLRTILWWIDEAILMRYVPQRWELLEEQGITGAIDLADLAKQSEEETTPRALPAAAGATLPSAPPLPPAPPAPAGTAPAPAASAQGSAAAAPRASDVMTTLATHISMDPASFRVLAQRIRTDRQVTYVWWLYNKYMTDGDHRSGDSAPPPTTSTGGESGAGK